MAITKGCADSTPAQTRGGDADKNEHHEMKTAAPAESFTEAVKEHQREVADLLHWAAAERDGSSSSGAAELHSHLVQYQCAMATLAAFGQRVCAAKKERERANP